MKIHPWGSKLFHVDEQTDGQTDLTKLIFAFTVLRTRLKVVKTVCIGHGICVCCTMSTDGWTDRQTQES